MKNYLKNNVNNERTFPYLGFILDENGVEHDFGCVSDERRSSESLDNYRHSESLKQKMKELYPDIVLMTENSDNLTLITEEISSYNLVSYLNLSGFKEVSEGSVQCGPTLTLQQVAALRNYDSFLKQHYFLSIYCFLGDCNYERYHTDINTFLDTLPEQISTEKEKIKQYKYE